MVRCKSYGAVKTIRIRNPLSINHIRLVALNAHHLNKKEANASFPKHKATDRHPVLLELALSQTRHLYKTLKLF